MLGPVAVSREGGRRVSHIWWGPAVGVVLLPHRWPELNATGRATAYIAAVLCIADRGAARRAKGKFASGPQTGPRTKLPGTLAGRCCSGTEDAGPNAASCASSAIPPTVMVFAA